MISRNAGRGGSAGAAATDRAGAGAGATGDALDDEAALVDPAGRDGCGRAGAGRGAGAGAAGGATGCAAGVSGAGAGAAAGGGAAGSVFGWVLSVLLPEQPAAIAELSRAAANQCFVIVVTSGGDQFKDQAVRKPRQLLSIFGSVSSFGEQY